MNDSGPRDGGRGTSRGSKEEGAGILGGSGGRGAGDAAEHDQIGVGIAAQTVGPLHTAGHLAGGEQAAAVSTCASGLMHTPPMV